MEQLVTLEKIFAVAATSLQKAKVLMVLVSSRFDYNQGMSAYLSLEMWKQTESEIKQLFDIVETNSDIRICERADEDVSIEDEEEDSDALKTIRGSLVSFVSRLDDEFTKSLQQADPHTMEYVERLKDEFTLFALIERAEKYYTQIQETRSISLLKMMRLEHIYHQHNNVILLLEEGSRKIYPDLPAVPTDADELVRDLCVYLYQNAADRLRARAVLCHVYHHALNKRFYKARDLLLMSHLQESIQQTDVSTQVLYNRAMVQIGIAAFRCGLIKECHQALNEIMASLKSKDILAQGTQLQKYQQTSSDMEKKERIRMLPFHTHINLELLECVQLTVSMLLEVPVMASDTFDSKKKVVSKHFRRLFEFSERQVFSGPPENYRDNIMHAAKALSTGDWKQCCEAIVEIKTWDLIPDSAEVKLILVERIKVEALRTFFFVYGSFYENINLDMLAERFELSRAKVDAIVSKMIMSQELHAAIDQPTGVVILYRVEATRIQQLALHYSDKANVLVESNERLFDNKFQHPQQQQQQQQHQSSGSYGGKSGGDRRGTLTGEVVVCELTPVLWMI